MVVSIIGQAREQGVDVRHATLTGAKGLRLSRGGGSCRGRQRARGVELMAVVNMHVMTLADAEALLASIGSRSQ